MRNKKWLLLLAVLSTCVISHGQERYLPDAPSHHKFWDRSNTALFTIHAAMEATDFGITHQNLGVLGLSYFFHKTGHHKWERAITALAISDSSYGVIYSFAHH